MSTAHAESPFAKLATLATPATEPSRRVAAPVLPPEYVPPEQLRPAVPAPALDDAAQSAARPQPSRPKPARDHRLDFWRGLCLIDMLLVHLIHQGMSLGARADVWVGEYTRFAAGGFVFIAGLSIGRIFLPRARDPQKRWPTYKGLWRRAAVILAVHYVAEIGFLVMWPLFGGVAFRRTSTPIWEILTFRAGYDLLPLYVVMVALAPGMLELMRRRLGWVLAAASLGLFAAAHATGWWAQYKLPIQHDFFPVLWQVIFVAGVLSADLLPKYDQLARVGKVALAATLWAAHVVLFVAYYGPNFGLRLDLGLTFTKVPLTDGEALRYLTLIAAIMASTDLLWRRWLDGGGVARFCQTLGRNSLAVYVFHVWVVQAAVHASAHHPNPFGRVALAVAGLAALWVFASLLEQTKPTKGKARPQSDASPPDATHASGSASASGRRDGWSPARRASPANWPALARRSAGGLPGLAAATVAAVFVANTVQRAVSPKSVAVRHATSSPAGELLAPRPPESPPDFSPDPADDDLTPDDDPSDSPDAAANADVGAQAIQSPPGAEAADDTRG